MIILFIIMYFIFYYMFNNKNKEYFNTNLNPFLKYDKLLIQTYKNKDLVPDKVFNNIKEYLPDYNYIFFNDHDCKNFLKYNYDDNISNIYNKLKLPAHKADLFRYCFLYLHGGLYCDIKTIFKKPIDNVITDKKKVYSVLSIHKNTIYQGIIYTYPRNPLFLRLIENFIKIINNTNIDNDYGIFTADFYSELKKDNNNQDLKCGCNKSCNLFKEVCSTKDSSECNNLFDKYGSCCKIVNNNNEILFLTRYSDFPWKN